MAKVVKGVVKAVVGVVKGVVKGIGTVLGLVKPKGNIANSASNQRLSKRLEPEDFRKIIFGETAGASDMRFWEVHGTDFDRYDEVLAVAGHQIQGFGDLYIEEELVTFSGNNATGTYAGALSRRTNDGTDGNSAISVGAGTYWDSNSKFTGCAHYVLAWTVSDEKLPNGIPSRYTQVIEGALVYDPRKDSTRGGSGSHRADDQSTWEYAPLDSNGVPIGRNNALQMLWYLIGWRVAEKDDLGVLTGDDVLIAGRGVDLDDIDFPSFIAAANDAEAEEHYTDMILSTGDGHSSNEAIISCDGLLGELLDTGGLWSYRVTQDDTGVIAVALDDNDIVGDVNWDPEASVSDKYNKVVGTFIDPSANSLYQARPYPHVKDASYELADGYKKRNTQNYQSIQNAALAQKASRVMLNRTRFTGQYHAVFQMRALKAQVWDCVTLSLEHYGWTNKLFRVLEQAMTPEGIEMVLREENATVYSGGTVIVPDPPSAGVKYDPRMKVALTSLGLIASARAGTDGTIQDVILANWSTPPGNVRRTEVQYKRASDTYWTSAATNSAAVTDQVIGPLLPGTSYNVRARHITIHEIPGDWVTETLTSGTNTRNSAGKTVYGDATTVESLKPSEAGANVTANHNAAGFVGEGVLARLNDVDWASLVSGRPAELTDGRITAALDGNGNLVSSISTGLGELTVLDLLVSGMAGNSLSEDPNLEKGTVPSNWLVYDNNASGANSISIVTDAGAPKGNDHILRVAFDNSAQPSPGLGMYQSLTYAGAGVPSRIGKYVEGSTIAFVVRARIPVGKSLAFASNGTGTGTTGRWLTPQAGTGDWEWYVYQRTMGVGGTLSSTGFFYVAATLGEGAFHWDIASYDQIEVASPVIPQLEHLKDDAGNRLTDDQLITLLGNSAGFTGEGLLARLSAIDAGIHLTNGEYLTGSDWLDTNNLFFNGDWSLVNIGASPQRPLGVKAVSSTTVLTNQPRYESADPSTRVCTLGEGTNSGLRMYFPFWKVNPKSQYYVLFEAKASANTSTGFYARLMELDSAPAPGETHMGYTAAHADPTVVSATRERTDSGYENTSLTTSWATKTIQISPTDTAEYMGLELLRWSSVSPAGTVFSFRNIRIIEITPTTLADLDADQNGKLTAIEVGATRNQEANNLIPNAQTYEGHSSSNGSNIYLQDLTPTAGPIRDWRRVRADGNGTNLAFYHYGTTIDVIPVREGEVLYSAFEAYRASANGSCWLLLDFYRGDGSYISSLFGNGASGSATNGTWLSYTEETTVPNGASFMRTRFYVGSSNTTGTWYMASPYVGRTQLGSDVTAQAIPRHDGGVASITVQADHEGTVTTSLPSVYSFKRFKGTTDVTSSATWSVTNLIGCTATISSTGALSLNSVTAISGSLNVRSVRDGVEINSPVTINRNDAAPPPAQGGGTSASESSPTYSVGGANTSFAAVSTELAVTTGSNGQISATANFTLDVAAASPAGPGWDCELIVEYKPAVGGSWTQEGATAGESQQPSVEYEPPDYYDSSGSISISRTITGLSADTDYLVRYRGRRVNAPTKSIAFVGTRSAIGS